jgi:hypothetical protein
LRHCVHEAPRILEMLLRQSAINDRDFGVVAFFAILHRLGEYLTDCPREDFPAPASANSGQ